MSRRIPFLVGALILCGATPGATQEPAKGGFIDSVMRALRLPRTTTEARQKGVPDSTIGGIIDLLFRDRVPAADAQKVVEDELAATEKGQPVDNFGAFVQAQHRAGLRGRQLADAIHADHARRGIGQGKEKARQGGEDRGKAGAGRRDEDREKPGEARGGQGGQPDSAKRSEPHGKRGGGPDSAKPDAPQDKRGGRPDSTGAGRRRPPGGTP